MRLAFHHQTQGPSLHAGLSSQPRCGRHVFLHGRAGCWWNGKGILPYAAHARPLDVAGGGCEFPAAMAGHQDGVLEASRGRGGAVGESADQGERGIWQRRYWEHTIGNDQDYAIHMDYIHFNPVKHGLVTEVAAWPFSSFHKSVAMGLYPLAWTGKDDAADDRGERR